MPTVFYQPTGKFRGITTFPSHEEVICLRCENPLGEVEVEEQLRALGVGKHKKRCPKCHLATSYDVSPAEASAIELEEPNWPTRFEEHCGRWPKLPRYLQEDSAFEATLVDWRRWHAVDGKTAAAADGMVALAKLKIFPPRNLIKDVPRDGELFEEQHDAHCWMTMSQRAWRVLGIEDKMLLLDSFGERTQVDLSKAKWEKYLDKAVEALLGKNN